MQGAQKCLSKAFGLICSLGAFEYYDSYVTVIFASWPLINHVLKQLSDLKTIAKKSLMQGPK